MKPDIKNLTLMATGLILTVLECFVALTIEFAVVILLADGSSAVHCRPCFARAQVKKTQDVLYGDGKSTFFFMLPRD